MRLASALNEVSQQIDIQYTIEEKQMTDSIKDVWEAILGADVDDDTDFFASGAGSMDVVRLANKVPRFSSFSPKNTSYKPRKLDFNRF